MHISYFIVLYYIQYSLLIFCFIMLYVAHTHTRIFIYTYIYIYILIMHIYIYIYIHIYIYTHVCMGCPKQIQVCLPSLLAYVPVSVDICPIFLYTALIVSSCLSSSTFRDSLMVQFH